MCIRQSSLFCTYTCCLRSGTLYLDLSPRNCLKRRLQLVHRYSMRWSSDQLLRRICWTMLCRSEVIIFVRTTALMWWPVALSGPRMSDMIPASRETVSGIIVYNLPCSSTMAGAGDNLHCWKGSMPLNVKSSNAITQCVQHKLVQAVPLGSLASWSLIVFSLLSGNSSPTLYKIIISISDNYKWPLPQILLSLRAKQ